MFWTTIRNIINFLLKNMTINAFDGNEKVENKIENSNINAPVQQARTIINKIESNKIPTQDAELSANKLAPNLYSNFICKKCGTHVGLLIGGGECPTCHSKLDS
ncbi:MAG: hypothetical protein AABW93_03965 [Nanoarchaeota archaeon]